MSMQSEIKTSTVQNEEPNSSTITEVDTETITESTLRLKLTKTKTKSSRRVSWSTETVDNEFLNKKKSKCCCIFHKTKNWDESSSEDENEDHECEHCKGHRKTDFNQKRDNEKHIDQNVNNCNQENYQDSDHQQNN